jgi:hypothetical protein
VHNIDRDNSISFGFGLICNAQIRILRYGFAGIYNNKLLGGDMLDLLIADYNAQV